MSSGTSMGCIHVRITLCLPCVCNRDVDPGQLPRAALLCLCPVPAPQTEHTQRALLVHHTWLSLRPVPRLVCPRGLANFPCSVKCGMTLEVACAIATMAFFAPSCGPSIAHQSLVYIYR